VLSFASNSAVTRTVLVYVADGPGCDERDPFA
jgi:hypothetical protein